MHQRLLPLLACLALLGGCATTAPGTPPAAAAAPPEGSTATLTLLETTDLHASVLGYDYYRLQPDPTVGLSRTATLIQRAR
ncbi:MAG TPA: bifunctional metallophosphatase/5'-nucleotidase, partial [Rhodanobacteraceae bacterium]|nr:bifunctional metallophosphatase/5'-nucleotidase [Rhodanobacteraceae bacterium]